MGKTRDLFRKIRGTKGTFHAKMGSIKDRNDMDLTETDWRREWQPTPVFLPGESQRWGARWAAVCGVAQSQT